MQMSRRPCPSWRSTSASLSGVGERLAENESAPTEFEDDVVGHRVDHVLRRRVVQAERDGLGVILAGIDEAGCRRPTGSGGHAAAPVMPCRCKPQFQQGDLPELVAAQRRQPAVRVGQQPIDGLGAEQAALLGGRGVQRVADEVEVGTFQVGQRGHREVALRAVDDLGRDHPACGLLEHALAVDAPS